MNSGDFWQNLKEDWQSVSPQFDVVRLRRQVDRKRRRMLFFLLMDVITAAAVTGLFLGVGVPPAISFGPAMPWLVVAVMWIAVIVGGWLRLSTWQADALDVAGLLRLGVRRARAGRLFVWLTLVGLLAVYGVFAPGCWGMWRTGAAGERHAVLLSVFGNAVFYCLTMAWGFWYGRRQRRKMRRAQALLQQLEQGEGGVQWDV